MFSQLIYNQFIMTVLSDGKRCFSLIGEVSASCHILNELGQF